MKTYAFISTGGLVSDPSSISSLDDSSLEENRMTVVPRREERGGEKEIEEA